MLAIFFIGIIHNGDNSTRSYFESNHFTLTPINQDLLNQTIPLTLVQVKSPQALVAEAQILNATTIYIGTTDPTSVYAYGIIDNNSRILYHYESMKWLGLSADPLLIFLLAMFAIIITSLVCIILSD